MCIAILNTPNVTFPKSLIRNCWDNNGDGAGLIYTDTKRKRLHTFKELDNVEKYYAKYIDIRRKHPKSKVVLHFRISTSGGVNITNTHPFSVNDQLAFVHNGVISELNGIDKNRSDTNLFNERVLKNLPNGFEQDKTISALISKYIGHSKLIFLNALNEASIVNPDLGKTDAMYPDCWFSNSTYKPVSYYDYGGTRIQKKAPAIAPVKNTATTYGNGRKVWQYGDKWNTTTQQWETPAPEPAVKQWDASANNWKPFDQYASSFEEDYVYKRQETINISLTPLEIKRMNELRRKPVNTMTAQEWEELNNYELMCEDF
jgi:hypothetical protein